MAAALAKTRRIVIAKLGVRIGLAPALARFWERTEQQMAPLRAATGN
jgi:hypothetical protein